jgi:hypothetical protein
MTARIGRGKKKRMKDAVKCKVIDVMMLGGDVEIAYNYVWQCWSLTHYLPNYSHLFSWRYNSAPSNTYKALTLKDALAIIDQHWNDRIIADAYSDEWESA